MKNQDPKPSREELIKKHEEFQKKLSEMFARTGITEIKDEIKDENKSNHYTISFQNNSKEKDK
jgi:molecular chaperone GrpE (heat shock protein)